MLTQMAERQELYKVIEALPDDSVSAALDLIKNLQSKMKTVQDDDGFYDPANVRWIKDSIEQLKQGKVVTKKIEELERMADG